MSDQITFESAGIPKQVFLWLPKKVLTSVFSVGGSPTRKWMWLTKVWKTNSGTLCSCLDVAMMVSRIQGGGKVEITVVGGGGGASKNGPSVATGGRPSNMSVQIHRPNWE